MQLELFNPSDLLVVMPARGSSVNKIGAVLKNGFTVTFLCNTSYNILVHHDCSHQVLFDEYGLKEMDVFFSGNACLHGKAAGAIVRTKSSGLFYWEPFNPPDEGQVARMMDIRKRAETMLWQFLMSTVRS